MKVLSASEAQEHKNSPACTAYEYPLGDPDINAALIRLSGRYPDQGRVVNRVCKELVHIVRGTGRVTIEGKEIQLAEGDQLLILSGERYFFEGDLEMLMPCTPAWYPEQHEEVTE